MRVQRGSIRAILQSCAFLKIPNEFRPFNRKWKLRRPQHEQQLRQYSARLRVLADDIDYWLDGEELTS